MGDAEEDLEGDFKDRREPEIRRGRRKMVFLVISRRLEIVVILIAILVDN